jgi:hypothetical protein
MSGASADEVNKPDADNVLIGCLLPGGFSRRAARAQVPRGERSARLEQS